MNFSYDDGSKEEQFFDYSNVTPFERFSAVISSVLKAWDKADLSSIVDRAMQVQGRSSSSSRLNNHAGCTLVMAQSPLAHKLPWRSDPYLLQLFLPVDSYDAQQSSPNGAKKLFPSALSIETPSKQLPLSSSQPLASSSLLSLPPLSPHIIDSNNMASKGVGQRRGAGADSDHSSSTGGGGGEGGEEGWDVMEVEVALEGLSEAMSEIMMEGDGEEGGEGRQHVPSTKSLSPPSSTPPPPPPTAAGISFNPSHHWWPHHSSAHPLFGSTSNKPQPGIYYPKPWWHPSFDFTRKNKIQKWFGIDHFVLILPQSYSRRFLVSFIPPLQTLI